MRTIIPRSGFRPLIVNATRIVSTDPPLHFERWHEISIYRTALNFILSIRYRSHSIRDFEWNGVVIARHYCDLVFELLKYDPGVRLTSTTTDGETWISVTDQAIREIRNQWSDVVRVAIDGMANFD